MRKAKNKFMNRMQIVAGLIAMFAIALFAISDVSIETILTGVASLAVVAPVVAIEFKEKSEDEINALTDEQKAKYAADKISFMVANVQKSFEELQKGSMTKEDYKKEKAEMLKVIKDSFNDHDREALKEEIVKLKDAFIELELKYKHKSVKEEPKTFKTFLKNFFETENAKKFLKSPSGHTAEYVEKTVSIASDYTGDILLTADSGKVITPVERDLNMRDIINVEQSDLPYVVYSEIYGWVNSINMLAENATLLESSFDVKEITSQAVRLGTFVDISKNMLKSVTYIISHVFSFLPKKMRWEEDFQILFGDGSGNNLAGIWKNSRTVDFANITFAATSISSIATWQSGTQTLVTFAAAHNLTNGYKITFANTTNYNATYNFTIVSATQILLVEGAYNAEATAAWTALAAHGLKDKIANANYYDAVTAVIADLKSKYYKATAVVINSIDYNIIKSIKSQTGLYLDVTDGKQSISGLPVVVTDAVNVGNFIVGDFDMAIALVDYEQLKIFMADDVSYLKQNKVAVIVEEQIILPIYNSLMFVKGNFDTIVAAIDEP